MLGEGHANFFAVAPGVAPALQQPVAPGVAPALRQPVAVAPALRQPGLRLSG